MIGDEETGMTADEIREFLNRLPDASEAAEVRKFRVYIGTQPVTVNVYDSGPDAGPLRYSVEAYPAASPWLTDDDVATRYTLGNPERDLKTALSFGPHWQNFKPRS